MKVIKSIFADFIRDNMNSQPVLCHHVMKPEGVIALPMPLISTDLSCEYCNGREHYLPCNSPSLEKVWLCTNIECRVYKDKIKAGATTIQATPKRAILWPEFCEINGIGDEHHGIRFELVNQNAGKMQYMLKFLEKPRGIILMQGSRGTGKTFASMGMCELFTRRNTSAIFMTQKQMATRWLQTFKAEKYDGFIDRITTCNLLVIDDLGTSDIPAGFLSFFMDLINSRMQWTDRGTVITTNLDDKTFENYCGEALSDRIATGQVFEFKGESRRKKTKL